MQPIISSMIGYAIRATDGVLGNSVSSGRYPQLAAGEERIDQTIGKRSWVKDR